MPEPSSETRVALTVPPVRIESPDALFAPDHRIMMPLPAPLYLLSCLKLPLVDGYPTADGLVKNTAHYFQRNTIVYADGSRFLAEVSSSPSWGLPTVFDLDVLFGIAAICDRDGIGPDGTVPGATYRRILKAGRPHITARNVSAGAVGSIKRALARWGNTTIYTNMEMVFAGHVQRIESGEATFLLPGATPPRSERERSGSHWILDYDWERYQHGSQKKDEIISLKFNPVWRTQSDSGLAAWVDVGTIGSLDSAIARGIYLRLVLAIAEGWRPTFHHEATLDWWIDAIGIQDNDKPGKIAGRVQAALEALRERGVAGHSEIPKVGHGKYLVQIEPGPVLTHTSALRAIAALDPVRTRVLLWHLAQYGIVEGEAREILGQHGLRVQEVLQRVVYERTVKKGLDAKGKPIGSWASWVTSALKEAYTFREPDYLAWLERRTRAVAAAPDTPSLPPSVQGNAERPDAPPPPPASPAPRFTFADDVWGQALARFAEQIPAEHLRTWFTDTSLIAAPATPPGADGTPGTVVAGAPSTFAADWIREKYGPALEEILSEVIGAPVVLEVLCPTSAESGK